MDSQHSRNIQKWLDHIKSNNLSSYKTWAPIDRFNRKFGFNIPPSVFWSFKRTAMTMGTSYGVFVFIGMTVLEFEDKNPSVFAAFISSIFGGIAFGLFSGFIMTRSRRKMNLGTWEEFVRSGEKHVNHSN